jgi:hypothetical protein
MKLYEVMYYLISVMDRLSDAERRARFDFPRENDQHMSFAQSALL